MIPMRKHSKKRDAILRVMQSTKAHPGAQWVYDQLRPEIPDLSLGTVYRNINQFRADGLAVSVGVVNGEERFDANVEPHQHFVCERCHAVIDLPEAVDCGGEIALLHSLGHTADPRKTVFYGICRTCKGAGLQ